MIEAYQIGVSLIVNDDTVAASLSSMYDQFGRVDEQVTGINEALGKTGALIGEATGAINGMVTAFTNATTAANALKDATGGLGGGAGSWAPGAPGSPATPQPDAPVYLMPGETPYHMPGAPAGGSGGLPATIPGQPYYTGDDGSTFYRSGYTPNFTMPDDDVTAPPDPDANMSRPGRVPLGGGGRGGPEGPHLGISDLFFGSAVMDMAGNIVAQGYGSVATPQDQVTKMQLMNKSFTQADGQKAMAAAREIVKDVPGISLSGALSIIANGYTSTRDIDEAIAAAKPLAIDAARLQASGRTDAVDGLWQLQQAAEIAGTLNQKNPDGSVNITPFTNWIDNQTSILQSDPMVTPNDIRLEVSQNDLGAMTASPEGQSEEDILSGLIGGYKTGTGGAQLNRELIGGKMSTGTEHILEKLGLIDPAGATKTGQYYTLAPHALKDEDTFVKNPAKWFETTFAQAVDRLSPNDRNAMYHDLIAGTGTAAGARSAALDVMQDTFIARQLYNAEQLEPTKAQSLAILNNNPSTVARQLGDNAGVLENAILNPSAPSVMGWEHWESNRAAGYASGHPLEQLWSDTEDNAKWLWNYINGTSILPPGTGKPGTPQNPFGPAIPTPSIVEKLETLVATTITNLFKDVIAAINGQPGKSASDPVYSKVLPGPAPAPTTLMPTTATGHDPAQSPPLPGQVFRPR